MADRREFIGRLIVAGPARTMTGEPGRYVVTAEAIRRAVEEGLFNGLACFADHSESGHAGGGPSIRRLVGMWRDVKWFAAPGDEAAGAAVGRLAAYETDETRPVLDLLDQWLSDAAGPEAPDVGISLVFYPVLDADGRTVRRIAMVESADLVMFPASVGSRILERGSRGAGDNRRG